MDIFKRQRDVHTEVAAASSGPARKRHAKDMRRKAKVINFGVMYGMGVNALRQNLGGTAPKRRNSITNISPPSAALANISSI